jgi:hypothetical protein
MGRGYNPETKCRSTEQFFDISLLIPLQHIYPAVPRRAPVIKNQPSHRALCQTNTTHFTRNRVHPRSATPQRLHLSHTIPFALGARLQSLSIFHPRLPSLPQVSPSLVLRPPHALGNNPMLVPILRAPAESFAADSTDDSGADGIVDATKKGGEGTGFQTNVNSRVVFAGVIDLFTDEHARKELPSGTPSGNSQFARDIAAWLFQETLTLRIDSVEHHRVNQTEAPEMYTTNDQIVSYYDAVVLLDDSLCSGYTAHISSYDSRTSTSLTATSVICNWSLRCSIPTSVPLCRLFPAPLVHIRFSFALLTDTVFSSSF